MIHLIHLSVPDQGVASGPDLIHRLESGLDEVPVVIRLVSSYPSSISILHLTNLPFTVKRINVLMNVFAGEDTTRYGFFYLNNQEYDHPEPEWVQPVFPR